MKRPINTELINQILDAINKQQVLIDEKYVDDTGTSVESRIASKLREAILEILQAKNIHVNEGAIIFAVNCILPKVLFALRTNKELFFLAKEGSIIIEGECGILANDNKLGVSLATSTKQGREFSVFLLRDDMVTGKTMLNDKKEVDFEITYNHRGLIRSYCISKEIFNPPENFYYGFKGEEVKILNKVERGVESTEYKATQCIQIGKEKKSAEIGRTVLNDAIRHIVPPIPYLTNSPYEEGFYYLLSKDALGISFQEQYLAAEALIKKNQKK